MQILIEQLGIYGEGVGRLDGFTVFVPGALPGETIHASLYEKKKSYGRAKIVEQCSVSPHRVAPVCPLFGKCGGCQLMHLSYEEQLKAKRQRVVDALERIGKFQSPLVLPCEPSPQSLGYRNKIQLPEGKGLYAFNTHEVVEVEFCHIHCDLGEATLRKIRPLFEKFPPGELRHVLIKTAVHTSEVLVTLVTKREHPPLLMDVAKEIVQRAKEVKGVVQNIHQGADNGVFGPHFKTLVGRPYISENILGLVFRMSSASFFQVNPSQAERLYQTAIDLACLTGCETVLDAFCGVGTLSLLSARHARQVIGVECVPQAIEDAQQNALDNGTTNVEFHCAKVEELASTLDPVDVAILNPPRKGCDPLFLERLRAKKVVYISCDPATLARDLAYLVDRGYQFTEVHPFDMFPQTAHVECIVLLYR